MLSRKTYNKLHGQIETKFKNARKHIDALSLQVDASTEINEILDAQYLVQVKALHDMDEPVVEQANDLDKVFGDNRAEASPNV